MSKLRKFSQAAKPVPSPHIRDQERHRQEGHHPRSWRVHYGDARSADRVLTGLGVKSCFLGWSEASDSRSRGVRGCYWFCGALVRVGVTENGGNPPLPHVFRHTHMELA